MSSVRQRRVPARADRTPAAGEVDHAIKRVRRSKPSDTLLVLAAPMLLTAELFLVSGLVSILANAQRH